MALILHRSAKEAESAGAKCKTSAQKEAVFSELHLLFCFKLHQRKTFSALFLQLKL